MCAIVTLALAVSACEDDAWFVEGYAVFDPRTATEVRPVWPVSKSQIPTAEALLKSRSAAALSTDEARRLTGMEMETVGGKSLILIRAIDLDGKTIPFVSIWPVATSTLQPGHLTRASSSVLPRGINPWLWLSTPRPSESR
jgi:hypothetical protein